MADIIYITAEAWNHAWCLSVGRLLYVTSRCSKDFESKKSDSLLPLKMELKCCPETSVAL